MHSLTFTRLRSVESLTDIDIALTKASRQFKTSPPSPKRTCIEIVSDVLLQHHAVTTRKWLSGLIQDLKSKGFTTLAVIDPSMHPSEEANAILGLFDGEIRINERETAEGRIKTLKILRLLNQNYLKNELAMG
jgi:hypothetical protein